MQSAHLIISGYVQGVGFRQFIKGKAKQLKLAGWVQNMPDKTVECLVEGETEQIQNMIEICKKGPAIAHVKEVKVTLNEPEGIYPDFEILP